MKTPSACTWVIARVVGPEAGRDSGPGRRVRVNVARASKGRRRTGARGARFTPEESPRRDE